MKTWIQILAHIITILSVCLWYTFSIFGSLILSVNEISFTNFRIDTSKTYDAVASIPDIFTVSAMRSSRLVGYMVVLFIGNVSNFTIVLWLNILLKKLKINRAELYGVLLFILLVFVECFIFSYKYIDKSFWYISFSWCAFVCIMLPLKSLRTIMFSPYEFIKSRCNKYVTGTLLMFYTSILIFFTMIICITYF